MSDIPTREEHNRLIRKIWTGCLIASAICFVLMMAIVAVMSSMGYDSQKIVSVMLIAVYIVVPVYGVGYIGPAFATSLLKMGMAVEMSREGLDIGHETAGMIGGMKDELKPVISDLRHIADRLEQSVVKDGILEKVEGHMKAIRDRIERDTKPLENPQRRDRTSPLPDPVPAAIDLDEIERMEDALNGDGFPSGT